MKTTLEEDPLAYSDKEELVGSLLMMYRSLVDSNDAIIANGRLLDTIRQVQLPVMEWSTNRAGMWFQLNGLDVLTPAWLDPGY